MDAPKRMLQAGSSAIIYDMCGRFRQTRSQKYLEEYFDARGEIDAVPRYNIAPSQPIVTVRQDASKPTRALSTMRWGLVPSWAKDMSMGYKTINARAETVATTASFREPFKSQRCLIPADGFYEWQRNGKAKQPYCFELTDGEVFAFAGLWDKWRNPQGELIESCTILTTTPNSLLSDIHDRMPVILSHDNYDLWLDSGFRNTVSLSAMLRPLDAMFMKRYPVGARINSVQNDDADCAKPLQRDPSPSQARLF